MKTAAQTSKERKQKDAAKVMANKAKIIKVAKADELRNISTLKCDDNIYPRTMLQSNRVNIYKDAMRNGDIFPAIIVETRGGKPTGRIIDGWHRYEAARQLGNKQIPVKFLETKDDIEALRKSFLANIEHGLPYSSIEVKQYVKTAEELGMSITLISADINKPEKKVNSIIKNFGVTSTGKSVALKKGLGHLKNNKTVTKQQLTLNKKWMGQSPTTYVRLLLMFFKANAYVNFKEMPVLKKEMDKLVDEWLEIRKYI